jgi:hypothetical protein
MKLRHVLLSAALLCAGCLSWPYAQVASRPGYNGSKSVTVVVHDQRADVLSGDRAPDYVGKDIGLWAYSTFTDDRRPLAANIADSLTHGLSAAGFHATAVHAGAKEDDELVRQHAMVTHPERALIVTVRKWYSAKSYWSSGVQLWYDLKFQVLDSSGKPMAEASLANGGFSSDFGGKRPLAVYEDVLKQGLEAPQIRKALGG